MGLAQVFLSAVGILESEQTPFSHFFSLITSLSFSDFDFFSLVHFSPSKAFSLSVPQKMQIKLIIYYLTCSYIFGVHAIFFSLLVFDFCREYLPVVLLLKHMSKSLGCTVMQNWWVSRHSANILLLFSSEFV